MEICVRFNNSILQLIMNIRIFVPDWVPAYERFVIVPFLHPFLATDKTKEDLIEQYGDWFTHIEMVCDIALCHVVMPAHYINFYYKNKKQQTLFDINRLAIVNNKLTVCWTSGDSGVTPPLQHFHLYRLGGYLSRNEGNQFCFPSFIPDVAKAHFNGKIPEPYAKTPKPVIGFCGQGKAGYRKLIIDIARVLKMRLYKLAGRTYEDAEELRCSAFDRSAMLDILERSPLIITNFIRHKQYRAGAKTAEEKKAGNELFYTNLIASQYILCYRGTGNFSVRLYETMACGRIPILVGSDNNLPFRYEIDWHQFPAIDRKDIKHLPQKIAEFHDMLSPTAFVKLQHEARLIWESYLYHQSFMKLLIEKYSGWE